MEPVSTNSEAQNSESGTLNRRRLLQVGAAAAPLVLTLRGGSAWAASSVSRCNIVGGKKIPNNKLSARCKASLGLKARVYQSDGETLPS